MRPSAAIVLVVLIALLSPGPADASVSIDEEEVVFRFPDSGAAKVYLVGDFNGWNATVDLLTPVEGAFEIRLYLVPGSYRYRFVADGIPQTDPENPCMDPDGNSCFTLFESAGALDIELGIGAPSSPIGRGERVETAGALRLAARSGKISLCGDAGVAGFLGERVIIDCLVGFESRAEEGRSFAGASYLVSSSASYDLGGRRLGFFSRKASALDDESGVIALFGRIGPYRYPAGVMSRGASAEGALAAGLDARIVYADRIDDYRAGLGGTAPGDSSARRELVDADALGVRIRGTVGRAAIHALYRIDSRKVEGEWNDPETGASYRGYERIGMKGGAIELRGEEGWRFEGAFLLGKGDRIATSVRPVSIDTFSSVSIAREWERGYRFIVGVSRDGARIDARISLARETIVELAAAGPDHTMDEARGELSCESGELKASLSGSIERYGASGAGERFWLAPRNFWLDGDCVTFERLPFFSSREQGEVGVSVEYRRERFAGLPWGVGTAVDIRRRAGSGEYSPRAVEVRLSNGTFIHRRAAFLLDMRGISYRHGAARGDFVAAFFGLHAALSGSSWCLLGCGVSPFAFDGRLHEYASWGRERYLEERGAFEALANEGERAAIRNLLDAEEALADDWLVTLQAGFTF